MAIGWLTVLQNVPWTDVVRNAPKVAAGAKKLWDAASNKAPAQGAVLSDAEPAELKAALEPARLLQRLQALEAQMAGLHEQLASSSALVKALADQNAELVNGIQALQKRLVWVTAATVVLVSLLLFATVVYVWS